ncbi:MAG: hypothetical protein LOX97_05880 [Sphingomonas sp.]|nr:hypothetical protein [Sphingomonas sp.]
MRILLAAPLLALATAAIAQSPAIVMEASKLDAEWQSKTREIFQKSVEIPTVAGRGEMPRLAQYLAGELKAA